MKKKISFILAITGDSEITPDTMYGIGSVSKMFTTAAVMKLAEQGKVDLDSPVTKYLPDFKMADGRYKKITVRMLLNHSSGMLAEMLDYAGIYATSTVLMKAAITSDGALDKQDH